jgi:hypothetical protein
VFLQLFPLLARDSTLSIHNKPTLYKLMIRPVLTYADPVCSNTSQSNYRHLQILQSECPKSNRRLSQTNPHTLPSFHAVTRIHSYFHLLADGEFFSEFYHALQPSYFPNRKLFFTRSPRTVHKIHAQTDQTSPTVDLIRQSQSFLHCIYCLEGDPGCFGKMEWKKM